MISTLIVSQVLSWGIIIVLGLMVLALMRQVGVLHERIAPAGALAMNKKLSSGEAAPELPVRTIHGNDIYIGGSRPDNHSQLVFFLSPECPVCNTLLPILHSARKSEDNWLNVILASDGELEKHTQFIEDKNLGGFDYVVSELLGKTFGISKLPFAVLIDEDGKIASMGLINSREHLESLFIAKEKKVSSIQEYMKGAGSHH